MSSNAHRRVSIDVFGPAATLLTTQALYCDDGVIGERTVKKWAREEATKRGIKLGAWDHLRHDTALEWNGRVFGEYTPKGDYLAHFRGDLFRAVAFEASALAIGDDLLPEHARAVRDGGEATDAYWTWLLDQAERA